jgi:hypothetical protein
VPETWRSPAHVALNDPLADVPVVSVAFHWKFVQELGEGMTLPDVQLPSSALMPDPDGPVTSLLRSKPTQPADEAATDKTRIHVRFFIERSRMYISGGVRPEFNRWESSQNYTSVELGKTPENGLFLRESSAARRELNGTRSFPRAAPQI